MRMLVSVRSVDEALLAATAGADFIDLKEPSAGALGALPLATARAVVTALQALPQRPLISATVGDFAPGAIVPVLERVAQTAACGVDYVKVGIAPGALELLHALAHCETAVVPVLIADAGVDAATLAHALRGPFPALMLDTQDKRGGSLLARLDDAALRGFIERCRTAGKLAGLAGALREDDLPRLRGLAADFAGFRSAVCSGPRTAALDPARVRALREQLVAAEAAA
ncbi:MAG TPA: (5-formylfuran-3-yl)methyl phosphate synthase [Methylibium sp.]|nr:(5-formylfuran-3-yl)methyl phosphate synthase [Methylibium sp.]